MKKYKVYWIILFSALSMFLLTPRESYACSCGYKTESKEKRGYNFYMVRYFMAGRKNSHTYGTMHTAALTESEFREFEKKFVSEGYDGMGEQIHAYFSQRRIPSSQLIVGNTPYKISRGDTLRKIAIEKYGISTRELLLTIGEANNIKNLNLIYADTVIYLPNAVSSTEFANISEREDNSLMQKRIESLPASEDEDSAPYNPDQSSENSEYEAASSST